MQLGATMELWWGYTLGLLWGHNVAVMTRIASGRTPMIHTTVSRARTRRQLGPTLGLWWGYTGAVVELYTGLL